MKSKRFFTVKLLVFLFCLFYGAGVTPLFAQNFKQTLQWSADPNVLEYKVEIQDSTGKIINSVTTENNSISLSLKEGTYKYKITAYDLLGREAVSTNWISFEVVVAKQPVIEHTKNLEALQEDGKTLEINLDVDDVTADTVAELVNIASGAKIRGKLVLAAAAGAPAVGLSASETHKATKARFTDVPEGNWKLVITNPSGLSTESEAFEVKDVIKEERIAKQKAEEERLAREKAEREEAERIAAEKAEQERIAREERERIEREKAEEEARRLAELETQRLAEIEEAERQERERLALEQAERERQEAELRAIEEAARAEEERLAQEAERLAREEEEAAAREEEKAEKKRLRREHWLTYDRKTYVMAGIGASIPIYDDGFFEEYLEKNFFNPALTAQIGFMPLHTDRIRFGMELNSFASRFTQDNEFFRLDLNMLSLQDNLAFRFGLKNKKVWFQIKGGGGIVILQESLDYYDNTENNIEDKIKNFGYFTAGGGLSVIFTPSALFMVEIGSDFYNLFIPSMNIGLLNPYVAIGIRF